MYLVLCIYGGDSRVANKTPSILTTIKGTLRYPASIVNPTIRIDMKNMEGMQGMKEDFITNVNYFHIPEFNRYYFITSKIIESNGIATITGHVDVLKTFYDDYKNLNAYVTRSASQYNLFIEDNKLTFEHKPVVEETIPTNANVEYPIVELNWDNVDDTTPPVPDFTDTVHSKDLRYSVTFYENRGTASWLGSGDMTEPFTHSTDLPDYCYDNLDCFNKGRKTIAVTHMGAQKLIMECMNDSESVASFISSLVVFPFSLYRYSDGQDRQIQVNLTFPVGTNDKGKDLTIPNIAPIQYNEALPTTDYSDIANYFPYLLIGAFQIPAATSFLDYEPYTKYELYLPFVGYITLPAFKLLGKFIYVYLSVNYSTGNGTINVYAKNLSNPSAGSSSLIFTQGCQIGIQIPIGKTNQEEIERNKKSIGISTTISAVGSLVTAALGVVGQNPLVVAGGVMGAMGALGNMSSSLINLVGRGNSPTSSELSSIGTSLKIKLRKTKLQPTVSGSSYTVNFRDRFGLPLNEIRPLSALSGMTYVDASALILNITALEEEKDELKSILETGAIL